MLRQTADRYPHAVPPVPRDRPSAASAPDPVLPLLLFGLLGMMVLAPVMTSGDGSGVSGGEGSPLRQALYLGLFVAIHLHVGVPREPRRLLSLPVSLTLLVAWCAASLTWAVDPDVAGRRLVLTLMIMLSLFTTVRHLGHARALAVMRLVMIVVLVANYAAVVAWPSVGIHQVPDATDFDPDLVGNWRGVLMQKNFTGAFCALTVLAFVLDAGRIGRWLRAGVIGLTLFFLYETHSKTSMGLLVLALGMGLLYRTYDPRLRGIVVPTLVIALAVVGALIVLNWDALMEPLKDPRAFTGRSQIWPVVGAYARDHWLFGSGFGSFWQIGPASPVYLYVSPKSWVAHLGNGHNGYLDLFAQIGVPGLVLAVATTIVWPIGRILLSVTIDRRTGALLIASIVFCAAHNLTESSLLDRDAIVQVFLMLVLAMAYEATRIRPVAPGRAPAQAPAHSTPANPYQVTAG